MDSFEAEFTDSQSCRGVKVRLVFTATPLCRGISLMVSRDPTVKNVAAFQIMTPAEAIRFDRKAPREVHLVAEMRVFPGSEGGGSGGCPAVSVQTGSITDNFSLRFAADADARAFCQRLVDHGASESANGAATAPPVGGRPGAARDEGHVAAMDPATVQTYFFYYGKLSNQSNMLQDSVRTSTYRNAIVQNPSDFAGKRVMDVGAGSGILSFFCAQAGAARVYAVEASSVATVAEQIAATNPICSPVVKVIRSTVESLCVEGEDPSADPAVTIDGKVDVIVSEPIGTFLFNERMIESMLYARDHYLKPGGQMFPSKCRIVVAPFSDAALHADMSARGRFWQNSDFYGVNLSVVSPWATDEVFRQPIVDYVDPNILLAAGHVEEFDLNTVSRDSLQRIVIPLEFRMTTPCLVHGVAGWFDVDFDGTNCPISFSTAPWCPPTHWYQIRFLFKQPLAVNPNQTIVGNLVMTANPQQSYYVVCKMQIAGTNISATTAQIDLRDPDYRYYTNPQQSYYPQPTQTQPTVVATAGSQECSSNA